MLPDSERLKFSFLQEKDRDLSLRMSQDSMVMNYISRGALSFENANKRFEDQLLYNSKNFGLGFIKAIDKKTSKTVGYIKMAKMNPGELEVGYALLPQYWGCGYASEMLKVMISYALSFKNFHTLVGIVDDENIASIKVLTKQGFKLKVDDSIKARQYIKPNK